jgi:ketosteroid isomerase-like protein
MAAAFEKGRKLFSSQKYEIINSTENANCIALEVVWTGKLASAFGNLAAGSEMRAHCAMFLDFRDGKIVAQRNYDCFEPW